MKFTRVEEVASSVHDLDSKPHGLKSLTLVSQLRSQKLAFSILFDMVLDLEIQQPFAHLENLVL